MGNGGYSSIIMIILMLVIFYLFLILPENKKKKAAEELRNSLKIGDDVTTIGGILGTVCAVKENSVVIETGADRVRIEITKGAVSSNEGKGANKETSDSEESLGN